MEEVMNQELSDAIATLNRANRALSRIFGIEEGDYQQDITMECDYCGAVKGERCSPKCKGEE